MEPHGVIRGAALVLRYRFHQHGEEDETFCGTRRVNEGNGCLRRR